MEAGRGEEGVDVARLGGVGEVADVDACARWRGGGSGRGHWEGKVLDVR